jgi:hypothetical protein
MEQYLFKLGTAPFLHITFPKKKDVTPAISGPKQSGQHVLQS